MMPIINIIMRKYDILRRDQDNVIIYEDGKFGQIVNNLLKCKELDSRSFNTYDEFFNSVSNKQLNEILKLHPLDKGCNSVSNKQLNEILKLHPLDKGCKTDHKYINDTLTRQVWQNLQPY